MKNVDIWDQTIQDLVFRCLTGWNMGSLGKQAARNERELPRTYKKLVGRKLEFHDSRSDCSWLTIWFKVTSNLGHWDHLTFVG